MRRTIAALTAAALAPVAVAAEPDTKLYEMRTYTAAPGKLDGLNARFRDHTLKLFEKHGMANVGYFVPADNKDNKLVYFIAHKDKAGRDKSFADFGKDPEWTAAFRESQKDGSLTTKVENVFLTATDYSPAVKIDKAKDDRVFELRIYTASKGNLPALNDRFKDHTIKLFERHGMTNVAYWNLAKGLKQKGEDETLVYLLAHKSPEAMKASWDAFRADPVWVAAKKASEDKAGGPLTVQDGVKSIVMKPMDYSPMK
jgi:NIPSNAP